MGIGSSIFLIAVGAILDFAVEVQTNGVNLHAVGVILMIVGGIGLLLSLLFWNSWGGFGTPRRTTVIDGEPIVSRREVRDEILR
jgi:membrane protein implicated in regulation of membrane protease activity